MNNPSKPEVVVITGASAGVGRATVREFAKHRAQIALLARGRDGLEGARREVETAGDVRSFSRSMWPTRPRWNARRMRSKPRSARSISGLTTPWSAFSPRLKK